VYDRRKDGGEGREELGTRSKSEYGWKHSKYDSISAKSKDE
jgi:hypothetical protein